jgi:hypothetical protein
MRLTISACFSVRNPGILPVGCVGSPESVRVGADFTGGDSARPRFRKLPPGWHPTSLHRRKCSSSPRYQPHAAWTMRKLIRR